ncbi:LOW QUALITY PROTEIN: protein DBF4 homolog B [Pterocles gutturalis]
MAGPRPLRGKAFYLDLPPGRAAGELVETIRCLGGVTEILSKEISCVVSSSKEANGQSRTRTEKWSSVSSEEAKAASPTPSTSKRNRSRPHQKPPDTALISRGKVLQKAMKNQDTCGGSSILANARLWGVQILHVDGILLCRLKLAAGNQMLSYTQQQLLRAVSGARKLCQKTEAKCLASGSKIPKGKLKPPLKVEDQSRRFRPFHCQFKSFPDLNFLAPKGSSPFEPLKSLSNSCRARAAEGCVICSEREKSSRSTPVTVPKRKRGFCECCQETFEELQKHLQSPQHRRFALDASQYAPVDRIISQLTNSFVEQSDRVLWSCMTGERLVPPAQVPGGTEMPAAELEERQQPEHGAVDLFVDTERDHGLKTKGWSPCLPRDRGSDPGGGGRLLNGSGGLLVRAGLGRGVSAVQGTTEQSGVGDTGPGLAPNLGWGTHGAAARVREAIAASSEPRKQQTLGSVGHPLQGLPASRKRQPSSGHSTRAGKRPRLELGAGLSPYEQPSPVDSGMGAQGAGQAPEPGLSRMAGAGSSPLSTELSNRPRSSLGLDLCPRGNPGDPTLQPGSLGAASVGFDPSASAVSKRGWSRAHRDSQGKRLGGEKENTPRTVNGPDLESIMSRSSCPAGRLPSPKLPVAEARCCCSLSVRAEEKIAPGLLDLPDRSQERALCPGLLQPPPRNAWAEHNFNSSSLESDWHVQLLSTLTGVQDSRIQAVDRDLLQRTRVSVRDSGYESRLCSVLKQKPQLPWAGKEEKSCWNCCTKTQGAAFPVLETFLGSWAS